MRSCNGDDRDEERLRQFRAIFVARKRTGHLEKHDAPKPSAHRAGFSVNAGQRREQPFIIDFFGVS